MTPCLFTLLSILSPLVGFLVVFLMIPFYRKKSFDKFAQFLTTGLMGLSLFAALNVFFYIYSTGITLDRTVFTWLSMGTFNVTIGFYVDMVTAYMMMVVTSVSFLVHVYSIGYMSNDASIPRFMSYLSLFTFMMLMLVTSQNMIQLFFGWEGVGLASYLLIGFWYKKPAANAASMKAFIVNRIGDLGLVAGMGGLFYLTKSLDFKTVLSTIGASNGISLDFFGFPIEALTLITILLFIGAMGKSAQLGLHTWLPDAMEGPTPVSALIHAATMVTAGVFLLIRLAPLFEMAPFTKMIITVVGAITAIFAASIALTQKDIKRVIAYSTCSQLGYMFFAIGCGAYTASLFHLTTHAFFKALLFLGAGSVIHAMSDEQDMTKMGGLYKLIPSTYALMWIGSLALAGIPFFAGFYSKDAILMAAYQAGTPIGEFAYIVGVIVAGLTAFYSWRLILMTFHGKSRADEHVLAHVHESPLIMLLPLGVLAVGAIFSGYVFEGHFLSAKEFGWWTQEVSPNKNLVHPSLFIELLPVIAGVLGIFLAYIIYFKDLERANVLKNKLYVLYQISFNKWWIDELYDRLFVKTSLLLGSFFATYVDKKTIDGLGADGIAFQTLALSSRFSKLQNGKLGTYAVMMIAGVVLMVTYVMYKSVKGY